MRLCVNNIRFVKRREFNGRTVAYYVAMRSNRVADGRFYYTDGPDGLPASVRRFMEKYPEQYCHAAYKSTWYIHKKEA